MGVELDQMLSLVGRRFPGGTYTVQRWENVLMHDVVEMPPAAGGLVHPIGLFHVPLAACGWTYSQIFAECQAESDEAVRAGEYHWELIEPMVQDREYVVSGEFTDVERKTGRRGGVFDKVTFRLDLTDAETGHLVARVTNSWLFLRSAA
jgi:hypothetical protein